MVRLLSNPDHPAAALLGKQVLPATLAGDDGDTVSEDGRVSPMFIDDGVNAVKGALK